MPDELAALRALGAGTAPPSAEVEQLVRQRLLQAMRGRRARPSRRRLGLALVAVVVLGALGVAGLLSGGDSAPASIVDKAYAAINGRSGIMHFVVQYGPPAQPRYEEYWVDLSEPTHRRVVQSSGGRVDRQLVSTRPPAGPAKDALRNPPIAPFPPNPNAVVEAGNDPVLVFRKLLHAATVLSQSEIRYDGRPAYRLVIRYKPPYKLVDDVWRGERITYIVDRRTYFPLEVRTRADRVMGGGVSVRRYPLFEVLPASPRTKALLLPVEHPQPYRP